MKSATRPEYVCSHACKMLWCVPILVLVAALAPVATEAQQGARVKALNLAEIVNYAGTIVRGRVVSVKEEKHPDLPNADTVVVTLRVEEALKGTVGSEFSFRQYIWSATDRGTGLGYKSGQEILLMLFPPSKYGLSSPVGFEQGRFRVQQDAQGNLSVVNGWNNLGLMRNVERSVPKLNQNLSAAARTVVEQHQRGPIAYSQFKDIVRGLIAAGQ